MSMIQTNQLKNIQLSQQQNKNILNRVIDEVYNIIQRNLKDESVFSLEYVQQKQRINKFLQCLIKCYIQDRYNQNSFYIAFNLQNNPISQQQYLKSYDNVNNLCCFSILLKEKQQQYQNIFEINLDTVQFIKLHYVLDFYYTSLKKLTKKLVKIFHSFMLTNIQFHLIINHMLISDQNYFPIRLQLQRKVKQQLPLNSILLHKKEQINQQQKIEIPLYQKTSFSKQLEDIIIKRKRVQYFGLSKIQKMKFKYNNLIEKDVLCSQKISSVLRKINNIQRILGGGSKNSKIQIDSQQKIQAQINDSLYVHPPFLQLFNEYTNEEVIIKNINGKCQRAMQISLFEECIYKNRHFIVKNIIAYKTKLLKLIEVYMIYYLQDQNVNETLIQREIDDHCQKIIAMKDSFEQDIETQPCLDLVFFFEILNQFNSIRTGKDEQKKNIFKQAADKLKEIMNTALKIEMKFHGDISMLLQTIINAAKLAYQEYKKYKTNQLFSYFYKVWLEKVEKFKEKILDIQLERELQFYINTFISICKEKEKIQMHALLTLIKIDYLFSLAIEEQNKNSAKINEIILMLKENDYISDFIPILMEKANKINKLEAIGITVYIKSPIYRFLSISILLKYIQIISQELSYQQKDTIIAYLSYKYLCEKVKSVKLAFETDQNFVDNFNKRVDFDQQFKDRIIKESKERRKELRFINDIEYQIDNPDDIERMIAENLIEKWERDVRKRQRRNIAQKDDILLEVKNLYIYQDIKYLKGKNIFPQNPNSRQNSRQIQVNEIQFEICEDQQIKKSIFDIFQSFLKPNYVREGQQGKCKILGIIAEGGTGKSMLLKKIETILIEGLKNKNQLQENYDYIPLLIKCNSLDPINPSIKNYLQSQGLKEWKIENLQKSQRNKLILLDGYDEYAGEYFRIFSKLNLQSWINTLVLVTSREEKFSLNDANDYFSLDLPNGKRDEESYTIVQLKKFNEADINSYSSNFFQNHTKNNVDEFINLKSHFQIFLKNKEILDLLFLPINLFLFIRMIINLKNKSDLENMKANISDQIGIQEYFFKERFRREALDFPIQLVASSKCTQIETMNQMITDSYFEYFQCIAMQMFLNKGKQNIKSYLEIEKKSIIFNLNKNIKNVLSKKQQSSLIEKIISYVNSRIIKVKYPNENNESNIQDQQQQKCMIEFKHKSLFEYFTARAMRYDIDQNENNIHTLPMKHLQKFQINKKLIMNPGANESESQILIKLYQLMKHEIESERFRNSYHEKSIERCHKYIQFLYRSKIQKNNQLSQIDIGSSNLISALFLSKFAFPKLSFSKCSLSKAYIPGPKSDSINFNLCNFQSAFLQNSNINFDSCDTHQAHFDALQKVFDINNVYSFSQVLWGNLNFIFYTISKSGCLNKFQLAGKHIWLVKSKQISQISLNKIQYINKNNFIVSSKKSIFLLNSHTFQIQSTQMFLNIIEDFQIYKQNILVTLQNKEKYYGNFKDGFKQLQISGVRFLIKKNGNFILLDQNSIMILDQNDGFQIIKQDKCDIGDINCYAFSADQKYIVTCSKDNQCKVWDTEDNFNNIKTIQAHSSYIYSVVFSPNGQYLATGSEDMTCKIWDIKNGYELFKTIKEHSNSITSIVFSSDSLHLVTSSLDNTCKVWKVNQNFLLVNKIQDQAKEICSVAFSNDGKYLAIGSGDKTCKIRDPNNRFKLLYTLSPDSSQPNSHKGWINSVAFSSDSIYLATGSMDKTCKIWDVKQEFKLIHTISLSSSINTLQFSYDVNFLATGLDYKQCKIWNVKQKFSLKQNLIHNGAVNSVAFSCDNQYLATGTQDNSCNIWKYEQNNFILKKNLIHSHPIYTVAFSPDGQYLATGTEYIICKIWNVEKLVEIYEIKGHTKSINSVAFSSDGKYLATGSEDQTCKIWIHTDNNFKLINSISGHTHSIKSVAFSKVGNYLATGSFDQTCKIWNVAQGFEVIDQIQGHSDQIQSVKFSHDSKYFVTASSDKICKIWKTEKGFQLFKIIDSHTETINSVAFSPDGKFFSTASRDKTCQIWDIEKSFEFKQELYHSKSINCIAFSQDSKYIATASKDGICKIWNVNKNFTCIQKLDDKNFQFLFVTFSIDSKYLATCSNNVNNTCKIWNVQKDFKLININIKHGGNIECISFSSDNKYLVTGSKDKTCRVWIIDKQFQELKTSIKHTGSIKSVAFSKDSDYLATGSDDQTCKLWNAKKEFELIYTIQSYVGSVNSVTFSLNQKYLATGSSDKSCKIWNIEQFISYNKIQSSYSTNYQQQQIENIYTL